MGDPPKVFVTSILNDIRRKFDSAKFEVEAITSVLGSADLDLREAGMKAAEKTLRITGVTLIGDVYIRLYHFEMK